MAQQNEDRTEIDALKARIEALEGELDSHRAETRATAELNRRIFEALPGGMVRVTIDGSIVAANPDACRILGLTQDALTDLYTASFATETLWEDGTVCAVQDYPVSRALMTGERQPPVVIGVRRPGGDVTWSVFTAVPVKDPTTGATSGAVVTFFDITDRKLQEEAAKASGARVLQQQKLAGLGLVAGGIAHDFNNLLTGILGNVSLMTLTCGAEHGYHDTLDDIRTSAEAAAELTQQILTFAGQNDEPCTVVDLAGTVTKVAAMCRASFEPRVGLELRLDTGLPHIEAAVGQVEQIVTSLLFNAAESISGSGVVSISMREVRLPAEDQPELVVPAPDGTYTVLEVKDSGGGMSAATMSSMFDPFFSTKFAGRGLGLAAIHGMLRSHKAGMAVRTELGVGSSFQVFFPQATPVTQVPEARPKVLLVDDEAVVRRFTTAALQHLGYHAVVAESGEEGLNIFNATPNGFAVVLLDVAMPGIGGIRALQRVRELNPEVPVVMVTGHDKLTVPESSVTRVLTKPYGISALADVLKAVRPTEDQV